MSDRALEIRRRLSDPARLAAALGLPARRQRGGVLVRCPWHDDATPSCSLTVGADGTVRVKCFACGATADALGLVKQVRGLVHFAEVLDAAAELAGVEAELPRARPVRRAPTPAAVARAMWERVLDLGRLDDDAGDVERYLAERGILHEARADGWAALPKRSPLAILRGDPHPFAVSVSRNEHRIVIPWRARGGWLDVVQRRRLDAGTPKYVFERGENPSEPYGVDKLGPGPLVYVEGAVDVLSLRALYRRAGVVRSVVGLPGASSWRPAWAELARGRVAFVGLDDDAAGERGVASMATDLRAAGAVEVLRARPVGAKDWSDMLTKETAA